MKKIVIVIVSIILLSNNNAAACDVCGCSSGGSYMGILPQFTKNFIGLRLKYRSFDHTLSESSMTTTGYAKRDVFYTAELWGRFYASKRLVFFAFVPFSENVREETAATVNIRSVGDVSLQANYMILNTGDSLSRSWKQTLMVGAGLKLPTGKYQQRDADRTMLPLPFQIGTGAYSFKVNTIYTLRHKKMGVYTDWSYVLNGENELSYQLGNQLFGALSLFRWQQFRGFSLLPNAGIYYEHLERDHEYDAVNVNTGGQALFATGGVDVYFSKFILGASTQLPLYQSIGVDQPSSNARWMFNAALVF